MSEPGIRGVVVAHAELADALIRAVERITGPTDGALVAVSNEGLGPEGIRERISELMGDGHAVVFTDLREGSCGLAARQVCTGRAGHMVVTGANLPLLLEFVMKRHLPLDELVTRLVDRGRTAISAMPEPK